MQQTPVGPSSTSSSSTVSQFSTVPQFVVIHDQMQQSWKHPVVHYVFEEEHFPFNVPKERCVLVNLNEDGESVADCHSLSHNFQVTNCKISLTPQMTASGQGKESSTTTGLMLTIEGMSSKEEFEQSSSIFGLDELEPTTT
ncbi:11597_t:CDS:2 [Diversispora eburnea]|uniref:11597_t:CDS:1 n=1 Tax=Diversispora eburnea TaxID=1213867 RepID=A0A9N9A8I6_9GLOM|nr:11597_t:CDS:2 [Diversispora eburnea]